MATQTEYTMQDCITDPFVQELQRRGLLERAQVICCSWQNGFVAQDADGEVYAYNTRIEARNMGWFCAASTPISKAYPLGKLVESKSWRELILPMWAIGRPQSGLSEARQSFYQGLRNEGIIGKVTAFVSHWQKDGWLAMDANGDVFLFNCRPNQTRDLWVHNGCKTCVGYKLDSFSDLQLNWETCLVKLDACPLTTKPAGAIDLNISTRMDCWI